MAKKPVQSVSKTKTDADKQFKGAPIEGAKSQAPSKSVITIEDILPGVRS